MTIHLDLQPEAEKGLVDQARERGVSVDDFVKEIVVREPLRAPGPALEPEGRTGQDLIDACARVGGLFTDQEIEAMFKRSPSFGRSVDFE